MKPSRTFPLSWLLPVAVLASVALTTGAFAVFGQASVTPPQTESAAPTILLSGPTGARFTLVHSADTGWQLCRGWNTEDGNSPRPTKTVVSTARAPGGVEQSALERPLTVFVDGPTGFTFMYVLDEGWKFVGRVADPSR